MQAPPVPLVWTSAGLEQTLARVRPASSAAQCSSDVPRSSCDLIPLLMSRSHRSVEGSNSPEWALPAVGVVSATTKASLRYSGLQALVQLSVSRYALATTSNGN